MLELARGVSVTNGAIPSSYKKNSALINNVGRFIVQLFHPWGYFGLLAGVPESKKF